MECTLCNKQCVGNADTALNFRLNNHWKNKKPNVILAWRHFLQGHKFNSHTEFTMIDKLVNTSSSKDSLRNYANA